MIQQLRSRRSGEHEPTAASLAPRSSREAIASPPIVGNEGLALRYEIERLLDELMHVFAQHPEGRQARLYARADRRRRRDHRAVHPHLRREHRARHAPRPVAAERHVRADGVLRQEHVRAQRRREARAPAEASTTAPSPASSSSCGNRSSNALRLPGRDGRPADPRAGPHRVADRQGDRPHPVRSAEARGHLCAAGRRHAHDAPDRALAHRLPAARLHLSTSRTPSSASAARIRASTPRRCPAPRCWSACSSAPDRRLQQVVIRNLEVTNPDSARTVKGKLVCLDTLRFLRDGQLLEVVLSLSHDELLQFLKGCPTEVRQSIFAKSPKELDRRARGRACARSADQPRGVLDPRTQGPQPHEDHGQRRAHQPRRDQ